MDIALIIILVFSVVIHEMAHGYAANWLGDPTARLAGRLTANPFLTSIHDVRDSAGDSFGYRFAIFWCSQASPIQPV